ncbi:MAG: GTPase, partial [Streptomyces sp.]|uniref:GTPase n=1 Tax=Streptomyces sp. TaxID=1931 RepID=UPI003D6B87B5
MSTADVRIEDPSGEGQVASQEPVQESFPEPGQEPGTREEPADDAAGEAETAAAVEDDADTEDEESGEGDEGDERGEGGAWDDGLIARRARGTVLPGVRLGRPRPGTGAEWSEAPASAPAVREVTRAADADEGPDALEVRTASERPWTGRHLPGLLSPGADGSEGLGDDGVLRRRLVALWKLIDLSSTRLPGHILADAGRVLDAAGARGGLPRAYTTVAIAGATGSGKSSLFNALAGTRLSDSGMRRPTTATPVACTWEAARAGAADGLLDRLGIAPSARRLMRAEPHGAGDGLAGLVLIDLPDHDSVAAGHREQVDRLLRLVDAVVWVVDPEKYADALLHERYLRPLARYAEVTFVVLNQTDRLPGEATDAVLDDLRRLLDEDGMALGEHGEPGARVLATSALVGEGIDELRAELGAFVADRGAAALRLGADLDGAVERLRPVYAEPGPGTAAAAPTGLTDEVREVFADLLACAAGAVAAGQAAERAWL